MTAQADFREDRFETQITSGGISRLYTMSTGVMCLYKRVRLTRHAAKFQVRDVETRTEPEGKHLLKGTDKILTMLKPLPGNL